MWLEISPHNPRNSLCTRVIKYFGKSIFTAAAVPKCSPCFATTESVTQLSILGIKQKFKWKRHHVLFLPQNDRFYHHFSSVIVVLNLLSTEMALSAQEPQWLNTATHTSPPWRVTRGRAETDFKTRKTFSATVLREGRTNTRKVAAAWGWAGRRRFCK